MYTTEQIQDLEKRFPSAKAIALLKDEEFIQALGFGQDYFAAIDSKLLLNKEVYDAQYQRDQADLAKTDITVNSFKTKYNWWLIGACVLGGAAALKIASSAAASAFAATPTGQTLQVAVKAPELFEAGQKVAQNLNASAQTNGEMSSGTAAAIENFSSFSKLLEA